LSCDQVTAALDRAGAVYQTVYTVADIAADEHYKAREDLVRVFDQSFGDMLMQGVVPKFAGRSHSIGWAGRPRGADNAQVYGQLLGLGSTDLDNLRDGNVI
jgi:formyl-CoA transferase